MLVKSPWKFVFFTDFTACSIIIYKFPSFPYLFLFHCHVLMINKHLSLLSIILTELFQSIYDTCSHWTPENVCLLHPAAQNHLSSSVAVFIKVLDINDNVPRLARDYQPYICEGTQAGEVCILWCTDVHDLLHSSGGRRIPMNLVWMVASKIIIIFTMSRFMFIK